MKPRNGGLKQSSQDYMNLLYSDSDSDTPDLKLPPLKGKKPKKKKSVYKSVVSGDTSVCSMWAMLKIILVVVMLATLAVLGVVSYWLMGQVNDLTHQLQQVESRNQGDPEEFQRYHSQIQELNKTVHNLQAGDKGINKIGKNLTQIAAQLQGLKKVTDDLKEDLEKAPLLKDLPIRFESLTSTVAKIGSDVQNANTQMESFDDFKKNTLAALEDLKQRVANVENRTKTGAGESSVGRERGSAPLTGSDSVHWTQQIQMLSEDIDTLNRSLKTQLVSLNSSLLTHETRLSLLEKFTAERPTAGLDKTAISDVLEEMLNGDSTESPDSTLLSGVNERMDNITTMLTTLANLYKKLDDAFNDVKSYSFKSPAPASGIEVLFRMFQAETLSNLEYLNSSVLTTNEHVEHLFKIFTQNRNELNNVTAQLSGLVSYLSVQMNGSTTTTGAPKQESTSTTTTTTTAATAKPPPTTPQAKKPPTSSAPTEEDSGAPTITMELVHTAADLEKIFPNWDRNGEGQVDPDDLEGFMPDPPTKEQLKPFDANNNGKYSLAEMKAALGFTSDTAST